jgi:predicted 3-demethylubiquinone-9 3-methyltransferase (glyoxalase superfamily)
MKHMQKITPFLWFENQAEEAAKFYGSIFKNSKIISSNPMVVTFELEGQKFMALNGGPQFKFTEAISLFVDCETQEEVDYYWEKLTQGGKESQCGWLKDKYGLSWQIVPGILGKLMGDKDPKKANNVLQAMLQMKKMDIAKLKEAYEKG